MKYRCFFVGFFSMQNLYVEIYRIKIYDYEQIKKLKKNIYNLLWWKSVGVYMINQYINSCTKLVSKVSNV